MSATISRGEAKAVSGDQFEYDRRSNVVRNLRLLPHSRIRTMSLGKSMTECGLACLACV